MPKRMPVAGLDLGQLVQVVGQLGRQPAEAERARVDDEVAGEGLVDAGVGRGLERRGDDRDEADQADADHQRGGGGGGALGVAHRVLAGQVPGDAPEAGERASRAP